MPTTTLPKRRESRGDQRRHQIFKSLHDCILAKGYVKTTLADVAEGAGMSASHLLYYFKGKEDILEQYFDSVSVRFMARIAEFSSQEPRVQIQSLADFWFKGETSTIKEIGFMLECFGAAVNDDVLRITKAEFDESCKAHLVDIFQASPAVFMESTKDAAEISYALMIGLRSAVYFDSDINLDEAHRLFLNSILSMSGHT
ncbi:TetR/AcrR family transcriptional regulator [Halieaceae bacterium IMCC14734]|uniref:TetR/AcrR family transcriptional regulator n=1 Tax=Candidatus Litorirhabdus singularis TaxID=2518993 RepID=A0ABT3TKK4_9GAMM|nr:TetR/AcrR family transcriptional regulator [Candidatus Litorirhabdus singularis]MCX2982843.1 TetR/AcrR family transcriptional regulator [Candidatus Litorirhabdus singularis]